MVECNFLVKMQTLFVLTFINSFVIITCIENVVEESTPFDPACVDNVTIKHTYTTPIQETDVGCICGIFLTGQFTRRSTAQPRGNAVVQYDCPDKILCTPHGNKRCMNICLDMIAKQLPNSAPLICGSIDRNCYKEKAYLFYKNCKNEWINTNLSAGRDFCCKDNIPYKCP